VITRLWNARHGGVYVPVSRNSPPNPYLHVPLRDITVNPDLTLTLINPAYMTRQIAEIARERKGIRFHITSLNPIRPDNRPTSWERDVLRRFEQGLPEMGEFRQTPEGEVFSYMAPLLTETPCLRCHADQGYRKGSIRGGISVTLPMNREIPLLPLSLGYGGVWLLGVLGIVTGGKKLTAAYEMVKKQATIDSLTGIPNRRSFTDRIESLFACSMRKGTPLSVLMVDIDHFKAYNDTHGHRSGDRCLVLVARTLRDSLRRPGDFCARYGGEEFVVVLPDTDHDGAFQVAEKARRKIERLAMKRGDHHLVGEVVTVSIGVATSGSTERGGWEELLRQADQALYRAKEEGRNRTCSFRCMEGRREVR